jgi:hypothetical protein
MSIADIVLPLDKAFAPLFVVIVSHIVLTEKTVVADVIAMLKTPFRFIYHSVTRFRAVA